ncbi:MULTISPECIES: sugar MFS transporter [unclassified Mucilaginibacter]|uniref:sugar MFS transporter n=1 Tax=unclassified Mucilaginibacter TaxID=2617802 RepID=UPI002AC97330|nr:MULTISPECIES: sugar MFS transporter [unclassified Mucilaginibacter]MEB0248993.1 sugar MFS transporter [Mucilaginibacter sp. 5B2]MEB0264019.1 sugar MFS transporter [Mucilaginibacter sp. 10I4]MEB0277616.1 sugar MFS transporter [Mucilaginibacter sp. 10B2]MEB0299531.1 sugar MFS transporter [Mucilaginibacter sp. 5C4]WPX24756.1 sugar MFS transporter [Mucilaginibacter sp. 5C4]
MSETTAVISNKKATLSPIFIIGMLFFIFGFITWLNSVLIPYLKLACELTTVEAYLVTTAFYISYFVLAIPSAWILKVTGFKKGMSVGLAIIAVGALIFIPAALTRYYGLFLLGLFIQGSGLALLQTASNPYITILGPPESAAKRISIMGISNKIAGALAPIVLGAITLKNADGFKERLATMAADVKIAELNELASRVILPYIIIVIVLLILAVIIYYSSLPEIDTDQEDEMTAISNSGKTSITQFPHLLLGVLTLFFYVGVEVIAGDTIINYGSTQGIALGTAKFFTTGTLVFMLVGYGVGILCIPKYLSQEKAMKLSAGLGIILSAVAILTTGYISVAAIALLGLANSLVWPAIWPMALSGLGRFTKIGSSLLIMGIAGGAIVPLAYGALAQALNPSLGYIVLIPAYLFILYYAISGHKWGKAKIQQVQL